MKEIIQNGAASITRYLLVMFGGFIAASAGGELAAGGADTASITQLLTGLISIGISFALKSVDGTGAGKLAKVFVGPKVDNIAASTSRWVVGLASGAVAAFFQTKTGSSLVPDLGSMSMPELVVVLAGFAYDRGTKLLFP